MAAHERQRILVVDDDALSRELLEVLLSREAYVIDTAESGESALEKLGSGEMNIPDAVLVDLQMPGIRGSRLAAELRALCGNEICIVAISGSDAVGELLTGFNGFLRKPFEMERLAEILAGRDPNSTNENAVSAKIFDDAVYGRLATSMNRVKLTELYTLCLDDTRSRIASMQEAASCGDDATWRKQAHVIKGSCGMVGAPEMQSFAGSLEVRGLDLDVTVALEELYAACKRLEGMLVERSLLSTQHSLDEEEGRT
jgi:CheY-like chemotaxis protein/HPt (histidine-containing phosphotransfer) domain-containing protein